MLLGPQRRCEGVARVQRFVAEAEIGHPLPPVHAGLRDDVDPESAPLVILGVERVHAEPDLSNLRLRRQAPAGEPVDAECRAGTGHLFQDLLQFVGVVRQLRDLLLAQLRDEAVAADVAVLRGDDHLLVEAGKRQFQRQLIGALLDLERPVEGLKGDGVGLELV